MSVFLKNKFLRVCPYGSVKLEKMVADCKKDILLLDLAAIVVVVLWNCFFSSSLLYLMESIILISVLVGMEVPNFHLMHIENRVYRELLLYFSRVKHRYTACHHIANAVVAAAEDMSYEIQKLAARVYQVLMECDRKETVREFILNQRINRYLKLFLIQAYEASEKGDEFFSSNLEYLRLELMEEIYRRRRRMHEFSGYVFVTVTPFFMMPLLKQWGMDFAPELDYFYAGTGVLLELVTFAATIFIYGMISRAKEITLFEEETAMEVKIDRLYHNSLVMSIIRFFDRANGKISQRVRKWLQQAGERTGYGKMCFQMLGIMSVSFLTMTTFGMIIQHQERKTILEKVDAIENIAPVAGEEKKQVLSEYILEVTKQCITLPEVTKEEIQSRLRKKIHLGNKTMEQAAVTEIQNKIQQYKESGVTVGEVFAELLISIFIGGLPLLKLCYRLQVIRLGAEDEVRQFQSIILMERKLHGMTILEILEDMEIFSRYFKSCLQKCINSYGAGAKEALLVLKKEGGTLKEEFEELADAFLSVDEVGVELAFAEVGSNRQLLEKMSQLEAEISLKRNIDNTEILARIPMILAVGIYFILPFFMYSLEGAYEVFELLEEMQL